MQWCFLLLWVQGLNQVHLTASVAATGRILTVGNISAEEGDSVTLQCHLSSTAAKVTQVNWEQQDKLLASRHAEYGWHVYTTFREQMVPGPDLGLTLQSLTKNDTGEYFCTFYTYPDGIYKERLFLEVLQRSVPEHSSDFQMVLAGALVAVLVICMAVSMVVALVRKKKSLRFHAVESNIRQRASEQVDWGPSVLSSPGSCVLVETGSSVLCREQEGEDCAESHDYFNVLSYRSLGSFSFLEETV
ncbi:T-cell immunoreceptor with Ig and ITIM domains [Erinaceus europaeus]|uniref:T-cell immunoreceptor with Ig and ITIM domains n=1 Tax=Erinaceus europaeus TaxID=9365 RepID=UPI0004447F68|nr:T-cell immunoreceptor with Ig and ITIM domains [Erinaceus europaeus]